MVPFIEISFKSYEYQYIQNSFQQIQEYIPQFWQYKSFFLPNKIKKFIKILEINAINHVKYLKLI